MKPEAMRSAGPLGRAEAANFLRVRAPEIRSEAPRMKAAFLAGLKDAEPRVRFASVYGLSDLGQSATDALPALRALDPDNDPDPTSRAVVKQAIQRLEQLEQQANAAK